MSVVTLVQAWSAPACSAPSPAHFGQHQEGLATFLVYPPDELVFVAAE
jgi:hypothetical protein